MAAKLTEKKMCRERGHKYKKEKDRVNGINYTIVYSYKA